MWIQKSVRNGFKIAILWAVLTPSTFAQHPPKTQSSEVQAAELSCSGSITLYPATASGIGDVNGVYVVVRKQEVHVYNIPTIGHYLNGEVFPITDRNISRIWFGKLIEGDKTLGMVDRMTGDLTINRNSGFTENWKSVFRGKCQNARRVF
jgi:hypothetical protein